MNTDSSNKVLAIMQARMSSTRLPGKVLKEVNGISLLAYEIERLKRAKSINRLVIATSDKPEDDAIEALCKKIGIDVFRGSLTDVLSRYAECAKNYPDFEVILRVTGDCPLIDPVVIDRVVTFFFSGEFDYVSSVPRDKETFPDGMDAEVFTKKILLEADERAKLDAEREHVTTYMRNNNAYRKDGVSADKDYSAYRLTVDTQEDFEVVRFCIEHCAPDAGYLDYVTMLDAHPEIRAINSRYIRNEGMVR